LVETFDDGDAPPVGWAVAFAVSATVTPTHAPRENAGGNQFCSDGIDNDGDGLIDCRDPDCAFVPPCGGPAPTLSRDLNMLLAGILVMAGAWLLSRRRGLRRNER